MHAPTSVKDRQHSHDTASSTAAVRGWRDAIQAILKLSAFAFFVAGLAPCAFVIWLIAATGANNVCVDYAAFLHVVDRVLSGQYPWLSIFSDSFIRTHMVLFPVLIHTAIAYATHWDVTFELYVGISFHLARALLIADLLVGRTPSNWIRIAVTGAVMALVFSMSQTCIMIYGEASIAIGLSLLGFTFALWSLCKFGRTPRGLALMVLGGVLSSYSFGNVIPCWLTLLFAVFLMPARGWAQRWDSKNRVVSQSGMLFVRRRVAVVYWLIGTLVSIFPYCYFLAQRGPGNPELTKTFGLFDPVFVLNALGRPLAKDMGLVYGRLPGAELSGAVLLVLVMALLVPRILGRLRACNTTGICALLFMYGFASVWSVGVFRTHIAPWYASFSLYCWIAVFGACLANLIRLWSTETFSGYRTRIAVASASTAGIAIVVALYLVTNLSYRDKQFFLNARAPVSAEYLRTWSTAPTFLESTVFSNDGRPDRIVSFAGSLEKHALGVFAPSQSWSLQGQFALDNVDVEHIPGKKRVMWIEGRSLRRKTSWRDYHHLNLAVPDGNVVEWRFKVPEAASEAVFRTSASSFSEPTHGCSNHSARVVSVVSICTSPYPVRRNETHSSGGASYRTCCDQSWKPLQLNLLPYRGKTVTIRLAMQEQRDLYSGLCDDRNCLSASVLYMYPRIDLTLRDSKYDPAQTLVPSNTDLSSSFPKHTHTTSRLILPPVGSDVWKPTALGLPQDRDAALQARYFTLPEEERVSIDEFDYLSMQLSEMPGKTWCSLKMHLQFDDGTTDGISVPLLPDKQSHAYVYPAKLLTAKSGSKLVGMLVYASAVDENNRTGKARKRPRSRAAEAESEQEVSGDNLCNCIRVDKLAFLKSARATGSIKTLEPARLNEQAPDIQMRKACRE